MLTAEKMRELSSYGDLFKRHKIITNIDEEVLKAAEEGQTCIFYNKLIDDPIIEELRSLGYTIKKESTEWGYGVTIRWNK